MSIPGFITVNSSFSAEETCRRLEEQIKARGLTLFARIDHAAGAAEVGQPLRYTTLLIFGNARAGTSLMQAAQSAGIDLPLKALVCQDEGGAVFVGYNDPSWIAARHAVTDKAAAAVTAMTNVLQALALSASH